MLKKEFNILLTAIMFYTRIPVPESVGYSPDMLNKATRYFPLIGLLVGGLGAGVFMGLNCILHQNIAVILALSFMVLLTGAFHEDAFADFCDGFGGGYTSDKILSIMKDSRIGTYGAVGLGLLLLTKYALLTGAQVKNLPLLLISAHVFSRLVAVCLIFSSQYVGNPDNSKSKPVGEKNSRHTFIIASLIGISPLFLFGFISVVFILIIQVLIFLYFRYYIHKKINGYTGDVLGALQQISEVAFYLSYMVITSIQW
jgi:adenosylcobinamide-GDP ribazoletransferase